MRYLIVLLLVVVNSAWATPAKHIAKAKAPAKKVAKVNAKKMKGIPNVHVLKWAQLMKMPAKKRKAYVRMLAKIAVMIEARAKTYEVADEGAMNLRKQIAQLMKELAILPEAHADSLDAFVWPIWDDKSKGLKCLTPGTVWQPDVGLCVWGNAQAPGEVHGSSPCPEYTTKILKPFQMPWDRNFFYCVPTKTYVQLSDDKKKLVDNADPDLFTMPTVANDKFRTLNVLEHDIKGGTPLDDDANISGQEKIRLADKIINHPTGAPPPPPAMNSSGSPDERDARNHATQTPDDSTSSGGDDTTVDQSGDNTAAGDKCAIQGFQCKDWSQVQKDDATYFKTNNAHSPDYVNAKQAIDAFRADADPGANVCVYGGFFAKYDTNAKKAGTCNKRNQKNLTFPANQASPCEKPDEQECNPVLFCIQRKGHPEDPQIHCEPRKVAGTGSDITNRCFKWFESKRNGTDMWRAHCGTLKAEKNSVQCDAGAKETDTKWLDNVQMESCDPAQVGSKLQSGIQEEWEAMRAAMDAQFDTWCSPQTGNKNFQALFCTECQAMAKARAYAIDRCETVSLVDGTAAPEADPGGQTAPAPETTK